MSAYEKLEKHFREIANFEHAGGILNWDNATMMPSGSADVRASAMATLSVHIHALSTDPHIADWQQMQKTKTSMSGKRPMCARSSANLL